jgi:hypothetical protein
MPVDDVLKRHSSRQLAEWMAFERVSGPIGTAWRDEQLGEINELLQGIRSILHSAFGASGTEPIRTIEVVRPGKVYEDFKRRFERGEIE